MATKKSKKYNWEIEINGLIAGKAQTVKIPKASREEAMYSEGADNYLTKEPMRPKVENATIKGLILESDSFFWDWFKAPEKKLVIVRLLNDDKQVMRKYEFKESFPISVDTDELDYANANEFVMETLELSVREVVRKNR